MDCLKKEEKAVKNKELVFYIIRHLDKVENLNNTVRSFVDYLKGKYNDNENDNEKVTPT